MRTQEHGNEKQPHHRCKNKKAKNIVGKEVKRKWVHHKPDEFFREKFDMFPRKHNQRAEYWAWWVMIESIFMGSFTFL